MNKNTLDYIWNLHEACELAEDLGYNENYLDGAEISDEYTEEVKEKISSLVGDEWPQEVLDSYNKGLAQGSYES